MRVDICELLEEPNDPIVIGTVDFSDALIVSLPDDPLGLSKWINKRWEEWRITRLNKDPEKECSFVPLSNV